ncbi:MAG: efflux RND transporter periplasmic adaptor subunit [Solirubrobacteraceae bacterium]
MTVAFSESDISEIHVGQPATITLDALTGVELPARVTAISPLGSSSSGVVSYDATLTLKGSNPRVKPGMSASASVVTAQASGVNLPSSAVSGTSGSVAHVEVMNGGNEVSTAVVVGLVGDTRTQIVSGLRAGQQVVVTETLPSLSAPAATTSSPFGSGGGGFSGGGLGGGGGGGIRRIFGGGLGGG